MKIRTGFVSNSSSSSFVIRGAKYSVETVRLALDIETEDIFDDLWRRKDLKPLTFEGDRFFFSSDSNENVIIGMESVRLDDGMVTELPEPDENTDNEIKNKLIELGLPSKELRTYVQFVSNDNY
jgi:hypothetical protein